MEENYTVSYTVDDAIQSVHKEIEENIKNFTNKMNYMFLIFCASYVIMFLIGSIWYYRASQEILELQEQNDVLEQKVEDLEAANVELAENIRVSNNKTIESTEERLDDYLIELNSQNIQIEMLWDAIVTGEIPTYYTEGEN